ncbi:MAG: phenylacetate--CoA ligase family protein [Desulfomonilaceae bacterium]
MNHRFLGASYREILEANVSRSFLSEKALREYRDNKVKDFIKHAVKTTPYYGKLFAELGISSKEIQTFKDLEKIPVLTKRNVQDYFEDLQATDTPNNTKVLINTSGTTGMPLKVYTTVHGLTEMYAVWGRYYHWHGITPGEDWCAVFGARPWVDLAQKNPPFWRYNHFGKQILFSAFHMTQENIKYYVSEMRRKQPPWIQGFPSLIVLLANYLLENRQTLGYPVKHVTFGAENVFSYQIEAVKEAFGVRPRQHYGLVEAVANISECELGKLHVDEDFGAVEFMPKGNGTFALIGTNFTNPAMPLIRYDTNDFVTLDYNECDCGRHGRVVKEIDGRIEDYIVKKDGSKIAQMDSIFKGLTSIRAAQFYQDKPGAFTLRIVKGKKYSKSDERILLVRIGVRVGPETEVQLDYVDELERSAGGKIRLFINKLPSV